VRITVALLLLCSAPAVGCSGAIGGGSIGDPDQHPAASGGGGGKPGGAGGMTASLGGAGGTSGGSQGGAGMDPALCSADVPLVQARRLTAAEYNATVRDLFPGLALPAIDLAQEIDASGFENRAAVMHPTALLLQQYSDAAAAIAEKAVADLSALLPCTPAAGREAACGAQFVAAFGARIFRRPLTDVEQKTYGDFLEQQRTAISFRAGVQLTIEALLQAPAFLYRVERGDPATAENGRVRLTSYELASRLSYLLWGTMPDALVLDAAKANRLGTPSDREAQARRMLGDPRARGAILEFHRQWLDLDGLAREPTKDPALYPAYTPALQASLREESDRFVTGVMVDGDGTLKSLLTSRSAFVDANLARYYGVMAPPSGWAAAELNPAERAGFLTRGNFLASHAHAVSGSPPLRAVFIMKRLLCTMTPPPPADADTSPPKPKMGDGPKTNRQLFEERTVGACLACHTTINGLGFGLENYDAVGGFRTMDNGLPVNAAGALDGVDVSGPFTGGVELSGKLGDSADVQACVTGQWYEYALGRDRAPSDDCKIAALGALVARAGGDIRELLVALVNTNEFLYRPVVMP
jgi:hypothetical protein